MAKAYSYLRFSTPEQAKGDSYRRQVEKAREYAISRGLELDENLTFEDRGISGFKGANAKRGALKRFRDAVEQGIVEEGSFLLVENLDRISRQNAWEAMPVFQEIINAGVSIVTVQDGRVWSKEELQANPYKIMESIIIMIRANEESVTKSRRLKAVNSNKRAKVRAGQGILTRRLPAWLRVNEDSQTIEVIPERAKVVAEIFDWANAGFGKDAIARRLNERREPTFGQAEYWHRSYIDKILGNPATIGTLIPRTRDVIDDKVHRKAQEPIEGYFPPVVNEGLFKTIEALRNTRAARGRYAGRSANSLFAGLTTCDLCNSSFIRVCKGKYTYLVCSKASAKGGCEYLAVPYGNLEETLRENIKTLINEIPRGEDSEEIEGTIESLRQRLFDHADELRFLAADYRETKSPTIRSQIDEVEKHIEEDQAELKRLTKERENRSPLFIQRRMERLQEATDVDPWEPGEVNRALKENIKELRVNPKTGTVAIQWQTGRWANESLAFYSKHSQAFEKLVQGYIYEPKKQTPL